VNTASTLRDAQDRLETERFRRRVAEGFSVRPTDHPLPTALHGCPACGHVERHGSTITGTCTMCPGLVELVAV
jgi:hypothetical protein